MAQGTTKKSTSTPSSSRRHPALAPKRGRRTIAPKKKALIQQKKITKKYTAGLIGKTERALAEKAGHLEMLGSGKGKRKVEEVEEGKEGKVGKAGK